MENAAHEMKPVQRPGEAWAIKRIPVALIHVDQRYQRPLVLDRAKRYAANLDMAALAAVIISQRADETYWVVDGQHRLEACKLVEPAPITELLCWTGAGLTIEREAELYYECNHQRGNPNALQVFRSRLMFKQPEAVELDALLRSIGYTAATEGGHKAGDIRAIGTIERVFTEWGADVLREALTVLRQAWPNERKPLEGHLVRACAQLLRTYDDVLVRERLILKLGRVTLSTLQAEASPWKKGTGVGPATAFAYAMAQIYNMDLKSTPRLDLARLSAHRNQPGEVHLYKGKRGGDGGRASKARGTADEDA